MHHMTFQCMKEALGHCIISAVHVSTPTLSYKYWLNGMLYWLYQNKDKSESGFFNALQHLARKFIFLRYLSSEQIDYFDLYYSSKKLFEN